MEPIHRYEFKITREVVDGNRHVNNVAYVRWMQDAANRHAEATGCSRNTFGPRQRPGWCEAIAWNIATPRSRATRSPCWTQSCKYPPGALIAEGINFYERRTGAVLAEGETDWVFVEASAAGVLKAIPEEIRKIFQIPPGEPEP